MSLKLVLNHPALADDALQKLTGDVCGQIRAEANIPAELASGAAAPGHKGDPATLGTIALAFVSSGAAVALFEVLKSYFARDRTLEIKVEHEDGRVITLSGKNLDRTQFERLLDRKN